MTPILLIASRQVTFGGSPWWQQALLSRQSLICLAIAIGCIVGLVLCARVLWRIGRPGRPPKPIAKLASDTRGTAMMEFALVFPLALFLILLLAQTTLVMAGNLYVHYAAFAATRTAIVTIPADFSTNGGDGPNVLTNGGTKYERIRMAAVWAVAPVGGKGTGGSAPADQYGQALTQFYSQMGQKIPYWAEHVIPDRVRYADNNTTIDVLITSASADPRVVTFDPLGSGDAYTYGPKEAVTIKVTHHLNLSIPYVRRIFADKDSTQQNSCQISAQYTLTNEGIDLQLPPLPDVQRVPPALPN